MDKQGIFKYALMSYLPQKYLRHASFEAQEADRLIIDFKSGRKYATERVSRLFAKTLSLMDLKDTIIVCIPASCQRTYTRRFRKFSENVCAKTGAINGFDHIKVIGKREKVHISGEHAAEDNVWIDTDIFQGKRILIIDDICTTSRTSDDFREKTDEALTQVGGIVTPMVADRADIARYNTFGNTKIQAECVAPAFDMIYNELQKLE